MAGDLPLLTFAEISMWGRYPWGGPGANPLPARFQRIWDQSGHALDSGFPYSEGKYDDINKFIFSRCFWKRGKEAEDDTPRARPRPLLVGKHSVIRALVFASP